MWFDLVVQALLALAACLALRAFYTAFKATWPEKYWDEARGIDPIISRSLLRYVSFRLGPVLVAFIVAGTAADRLNQDRRAVVIIAAALYIAQGVQELMKALLSHPKRRRVVALRGTVTLGVLIATALVIVIDDHLDSYVPTLHEVIVAATTALFVFVMSAPALQVLSRPEYKDSHDIFYRSMSEIDPALIARLELADQSGAFTAIAIVENLNRPPWVRRLERILMRRRGTFGLMQAKSDRPMSDSESVDVFIARNRDLLPLRGGKARRRLFKRHNRSERFVGFAFEAFQAERNRRFRESWDEPMPGRRAVGQVCGQLAAVNSPNLAARRSRSG